MHLANNTLLKLNTDGYFFYFFIFLFFNQINDPMAIRSRADQHANCKPVPLLFTQSAYNNLLNTRHPGIVNTRLTDTVQEVLVLKLGTNSFVLKRGAHRNRCIDPIQFSHIT